MRKKIMKKVIAMLCLIAMMISALPVYAANTEEQPVEYHVSRENPIYGDNKIQSVDIKAAEQEIITTFSENETYTTAERAGEYLREQMKARKKTVAISYKTNNDDWTNLTDAIFDIAVEHTGNPREGDYLEFQFRDYSCSIEGTTDGVTYTVTITYTINYYTNAEQEAAVTAEVDKVLSGLRLSGKSEYEKIKAIYDYVCSNVSYDYTNLNNDSYFLKYTAYAALINKTSVCQGYANLMYRLLLEIGIDTRIISGKSDGEAHTWNIVKIGNEYYNLDATWDATLKQGNAEYAYFLKCNADFEDHTRNAEYTEASFVTKYKMASANYVYDGTKEEPVELPFGDVRGTDWFYDSVDFVSHHGLMTGMTPTTFGPAINLSRAQFAVILWRMNGAPAMDYKATFPDVPAGTWYTDAVLWANQNGIITGYSHNGHFGSADNITREQMALMMFRYGNFKGFDVSQRADFGTFKDAASVSGFASEAMQWTVANGIITGKQNGTALEPQGNASRAECATIIMRFMNRYE